MKPEFAHKRVKEWQTRHGFAHPLDAYYDMQAQAEAHPEVWDMGYQGGQDEAAEALAAMMERAEKAEAMVGELRELVDALLGDEDAESGIGDGEGPELGGVGLWRLGVEHVHATGPDADACDEAHMLLVTGARALLARTAPASAKGGG